MIKPEELALIKGYTVTKEGILLKTETGCKLRVELKDHKRDYYNFDIRIGPRK